MCVYVCLGGGGGSCGCVGVGKGFLISAVTGILLLYDWVSFHFGVVVYQPPERYPFHSSTLYTSGMFNGEHAGHTYDDIVDDSIHVYV